MKRFFGWLFLTDAYLDTLTDDEILIRACSSKREAYAHGWHARKIIHNQRRLNDLMDRLDLQILAVPTLIFCEPPAAPELTAAEKRQADRQYDVVYRPQPPTRKTRIVKEG